MGFARPGDPRHRLDAVHTSHPSARLEVAAPGGGGVTSGRGRRASVLRVGLLGAGTVGREVARAFAERPDRLVVDGGPRLVLAGVAVRDLDRALAAGIDRAVLTDAPAHLVAAPDTDIIVELMGGDEPARTLIAGALEA